MTRRVWMMALLPAAFAMLLFVQTVRHPFFYDDLAYVERHPVVRAGEASPRVFLHPLSPVAPGLYRPVTVLSYVLDAKIGGMKPWIFHAGNILLHAIASLLVFFLARTLLQKDIPALAASLLFAVHPVHTEAVAWVSGRSELLAAVFVLLSALFSVHFLSFSSDESFSTLPALRAGIARKKRPIFLFGLSLMYFLALSSKEIAAPFPLILALLPLVIPSSGGDDRKKKILALLFTCIALGIYLLLRLSALGSLTVPLAHTRTAGLPTLDRLLLMLPVLAHYSILMVFPWGLRIEYDWSSFSWFITLGSALLIAFVLALAYFFFRRGNRVAAFGIAWFFLFLLPVANIIPIGELIAERFLYLPSVGFCIAIGALVASIARPGTAALGQKIVVVSFMFVLVLFSFLTVRRNADWSDPERLWRSTLAFSPKAPHARENLTVLLLARGDFKEAGSLLAEELERFPEKPMLHFLAGQFFRRMGDNARAREHFALALELGKPGDIEFTDFQRASVLLELERFADALPLLDRAARENPFDPSLLNNLGVAQAQLGMFPEAVQSFERAIALYEEQGSLSEEDLRNLEGARRNLEMLKRLR